MNTRLSLVTVLFLAPMMACTPSAFAPRGEDRAGPIRITQDTPEGARPGSCWANSVTPAIIETVKRQVLLQPAQITSEGLIQQPAIYKTESRQEIVKERREIWHEIVCVTDLTEAFTASLQRALTARGGFRGKTTGLMDNRTRNAIRKFQLADGVDSGVLTVAAARKLGLVAVERETE